MKSLNMDAPLSVYMDFLTKQGAIQLIKREDSEHGCPTKSALVMPAPSYLVFDTGMHAHKKVDL